MKLLGRSIFILFMVSFISNAWAESVVWQRQFGSENSDVGAGLAVNGLGNVFVSADTYGNIAGENVGDNSDVVLRLYDAAGNIQWTRQFGTQAFDAAAGLATDGIGNVYVSGVTVGNLFGTSAGDSDAFLAKFNAAGALVWSRQFRTPDADGAGGVSADGLGHLYLAGRTDDPLAGPGATGYVFVRKYDTDGNNLWTSQFGEPQQGGADDVSADKIGNVFVIGPSFGTAGWHDPFVAKLDVNGTVVWNHQFGGTIDTFGGGIAADGLGNAYISGYTYRDLDAFTAGDADSFVTKYDSSGNKLWTRTIGHHLADLAYGVATDGHKNVYITAQSRVHHTSRASTTFPTTRS
jgi:hypothetical protein